MNNLTQQVNNGQISIDILKMAAINANSIVSHQRRLDLEQLIIDNKLHIALVSETKLNTKHRISIENYDVIRTDRPNAKKGGGTAIIIRSDINYKRITNPSSNRNKMLEYTIVQLKTTASQKIYIISIYITSNAQSEGHFITELSELFTKLKLDEDNNYYVIAGDFNARHTEFGDRTNRLRGRLLVNWERNNAMKYKTKIYPPAEPTYFPAQTFIDIAIADARLKFINLINNKLETISYDSDHMAVYMEIETQMPLTNHAPIARPMYNRTKWKEFTKYLDDTYELTIPNDRNLTTQEIDEHIEQINTQIRNAVENKVPKSTQVVNKNLYITNKTRKMHKHKSKLLSILHMLQKQRHINNEQIIDLIKRTLGTVKEAISNEIKKNIENYWTKIFNKIDHKNQDQFFPVINKIFRLKQKQDLPSIMIKKTERHFSEEQM